jgi:hypothetical protein
MSRTGFHRKAAWDRGNGWKETKSEWQDYDKAVEETLTVDELKERWCPPSGSVIKVIHGDVTFILKVGPKEYRENERFRGKKYEYRKPTYFESEHEGGACHTCIPLPGTTGHRGAWHKKFTWSSAVKLLTDTIIPLYDEYIEKNPTMPVWAVV